MFIAIYVVLSILTPVRLGNFKFTFEAFPILAAALLFGETDGLLVGASGALLYQLLFSGYGLTLTTFLWVLPHAASGLITGLYARINHFDLDRKKIIFISIVSALTVTVLNILALYVDAKIYGYYSATLVFGNIIIKVIVGIALALVYSLILPKLLKAIRQMIW